MTLGAGRWNTLPADTLEESATMSTEPTRYAVNLDTEAGLAYVHKSEEPSPHTLDTEDLSRCDYCTPIVEPITGGNDGSVSPFGSADPDVIGSGVGAICPADDCPHVAKRPTEADAREALSAHIQAEHPDLEPS